MRHCRLAVHGALAVAIVAACQRSTVSDPRAVRQIIEETNAKLVHWYATAQADSVGTFFAEDAWQLPPNLSPLVGRDSIVAFWRSATAAGQWNFQLTVQDVLVEGPMAAERGSYVVGFVAGPNAPFPSFEDRGNYVVVWRREGDGVWRIVWDAPVSTVPLPPPPAR